MNNTGICDKFFPRSVDIPGTITIYPIDTITGSDLFENDFLMKQHFTLNRKTINYCFDCNTMDDKVKCEKVRDLSLQDTIHVQIYFESADKADDVNNFNIITLGKRHANIDYSIT